MNLVQVQVMRYIENSGLESGLFMRTGNSRWLLACAVLGLALLLSGCTTPKMHGLTSAQVFNLQPQGLQAAGMALITPSTVTGQEEDKQTLALAFIDVLHDLRPEIHAISLAETLSIINRAGLSKAYKQMVDDYRHTGVFDRDALQQLAKVTGVRYLAQLKLGGFKQVSKSRWGFLGVRLMDTQLADVRLFLQIWDSKDGSIAWEGVDELIYSYDSFSEKEITFRNTIQESARNLIGRLP
jgi:hypothetical protein